MEIDEILIALRAVEDGEIDRSDLGRLLEILDSWNRADLRVSCAEVLVRDFRVPSAKARRWESEIRGQSTRRIGQYELRRRIGQGGMGIVFEATHPNFERSVALKILPPSMGKDPQAVQRFLTEVKSAGRFNHPHIVHAYDAGIDGDIPFLVMEFVSGENLFQFLQRNGPASAEQVRSWLVQSLCALSVLESAGWVHGDVKPSNWILTEDGTLKLADLGLCRPPGPPRDEGTVFGSPPYIAPELLQRGARVDNRCDLYSLGATFYHLLVGRPPFAAQTVAELARTHKRGGARPILEALPSIPADLAAVVDKLLCTQPADRFANCRDVCLALGEPSIGEDLASVHGDGRVRAGVAVPPGSAGWPTRRSWFSPTGWFVLAALLPLGVGGWYLATRPGPREGVMREDAAGVASQDADARAAAVDPNDELALVWRAHMTEQPLPYESLYAWLAGEAIDHPLRLEWEAELASALESEASAAWALVETRVAGSLGHSRYSEALKACADFPRRLAVGRFAAALDHTWERVEQRRRQHLGGLQLALNGALASGDTIRARQVMRDLDLASEDRAWMLQELSRLGQDSPWLRAHEAERLELRDRVRVQREDWVRWIRRRDRELPAVDVALDPLLGFATHWLARYPSLREASHPDELWRSLHDLDLLVRLDPAVVVELLSLVAEARGDAAVSERSMRDAPAECRAARIRARAVDALERWDLDGAEKAWAEFEGSPDLSQTLAYAAAAATLESDRTRLRRGDFLRSGAFVARVSPTWDGTATFAYDFTEREVMREWRSRAASWRLEQDGLHCRNPGDAPEPVECVIPFSGDLWIAHELPDSAAGQPWLIIFGVGGSCLGVLRTPDGEVFAAVASDPRSVFGALADPGARWVTAARELEKSRTLDIECTASRWVARVGNSSVSRDVPAPGGRAPYGWVSVYSPNVPIRQVTITGVPAGPWIDARRELWEAARREAAPEPR